MNSSLIKKGFSAKIGETPSKPSRKVKSLGLPHGAVIGAVVRGDGEVIVPHGQTTIKDSDRVIVFTLPEELEDVERALGRSGDAVD